MDCDVFMNKKLLIILCFFALFCNVDVFAHPGRLDGNGCHYCRTNCYKYGLADGEYHCHNGSSYNNSSNYSEPSPVYGCTDNNALNYNSSATVNDGSCIAKVYGCTNVDAYNYNPNANTDDNSCIAKVYGCIDSKASNYDENANVDDESCLYEYEVVKYKKIKYKTVYKKSLFKKEGKVIKKGKNGKKKITYIYTKDSKGKVISKEKIDEEVITSKVNKVIAK